MRPSALLSSLLLLPAALASTPADRSQTPLAATTKTYKISIWTQPLHEHPDLSHHEKLAKIIYTYPALNSTIDYYDTPSFLIPAAPGKPAPLAGDDIVKLGFYAGKIGDEDVWRGIVTAAGLFAGDRQKTLRLHLDAEGKVWHVGFHSVPKTADAAVKGKKAAADQEGAESDALHIELLPANEGPQPHLNKPVVINKEGKPEGGVEEKTFLQK